MKTTTTKYRIDLVYSVDGNEYQSHFYSRTTPTTLRGCQRMLRALESSGSQSYLYMGKVVRYCFSSVS